MLAGHAMQCHACSALPRTPKSSTTRCLSLLRSLRLTPAAKTPLGFCKGSSLLSELEEASRGVASQGASVAPWPGQNDCESTATVPRIDPQEEDLVGE